MHYLIAFILLIKLQVIYIFYIYCIMVRGRIIGFCHGIAYTTVSGSYTMAGSYTMVVQGVNAR